MRVPLSSYVTDDGIIIYKNREAIKVPYPFKPFILVESNKINRPGIKELRTKIPEDIVKEYTKIEFETSKAMYDFRRNHKDISKHMLAIPFPEQIAIYQEDFYLNYPHDTDLILLNYDIETASKGDGLFTTPINNPILCIGWSVWRYKIDGTKEKIAHGICKDFNLESMSDLAILNEFFNIIQKYDPDMILDYNGDDYDMPYIVERAQLEGADLGLMGRGGKPPVIKDTGNIRVRIPGRIRFDIYKSNAGVIKDQTLFDLKSKSLKELARHYKIKQTIKEGDIWIEKELKDVELPGEIENLLKLYKENPDRLYAYQMDDVYRTEGVGHVYMRNCITLAEMMKVPLENIITMYSSYIPKLFLARNMEDSPEPKLINTETNFSKYNLYTGTIAKISDKLKYEGAVSKLYKNGYFPSTYKLDFASQYPNSIITWNLGPDTTKLTRVEEYTGKYNCIQKDGYNWYRIPTEFDDGKFAYDFIVRVSHKEGFLKKEIKRLKAERKKIKAEMKNADGDTKAALNSQQVAVKVIMNSLYGALGLKTSIYGDMISATMVTSLCRWCILKCMQRNKECLIETDSVTGDTPIYVRDKNTTEINIIPIEDLHSSNKKRIKYNGDYEVLTRNGWKNILYTKKHKVTKNIHRVKISDGYVDVTEDHSLFDADTRKELTPKDLNKKSRIETTTRPTNKFTKLRYGDLVELNDFCWLIGFFIAEGSAYEGKNKQGVSKRQITFNGQDQRVMKKVEKLANEYLSDIALDTRDTRDIKTPSKFKMHNTLKSSRVYKVQGGYNKLMVDWFKEFCYTKNRKDKKVPTFILNGTQDMKESFLKGLMDGDGYIAINHGRKCESLDSKFKSLAAGVRFLWNDLYNETSCVVRKDKPNITTYKKRYTYRNGTLRKIDRNKVLCNRSTLINDYVYDISTEDGTFVTAMGDIVLHNTDGMIVDKFLEAKDENAWLNEEIIKKFSITDNYMELELEGNGERAYFYRTKNYIIENKPGDYTKHGSSMKKSRSAKIEDRAVNLGIEYIFNDKPIEEVIREAYNFKNVSVDDFAERISLKKEPNEYDDQFDYKIYLAKQVEKKTGQVITAGVQMNYVICKNPLPFDEFKPYQRGNKNYTFVQYVSSINELDLKYYEEKIDKALAKFGISKQNYQKLDLFGQKFEKKPLGKTKLSVVPMNEL